MERFCFGHESGNSYWRDQNGEKHFYYSSDRRVSSEIVICEERAYMDPSIFDDIMQPLLALNGTHRVIYDTDIMYQHKRRLTKLRHNEYPLALVLYILARELCIPIDVGLWKLDILEHIWSSVEWVSLWIPIVCPEQIYIAVYRMHIDRLCGYGTFLTTPNTLHGLRVTSSKYNWTFFVFGGGNEQA